MDAVKTSNLLSTLSVINTPVWTWTIYATWLFSFINKTLWRKSRTKRAFWIQWKCFRRLILRDCVLVCLIIMVQRFACWLITCWNIHWCVPLLKYQLQISVDISTTNDDEAVLWHLKYIAWGLWICSRVGTPWQSSLKEYCNHLSPIWFCCKCDPNA